MNNSNKIVSPNKNYLHNSLLFLLFLWAFLFEVEWDFENHLACPEAFTS